jgi:prepilin-type N-terminal cleavage/methylation domain-containing protein
MKMIKQIRNSKFVIRNCQAGMTYVELIVVLSIFSIMTSIVLFDYNKFEEKIDIKILANDIALKIIEAQKSSVSGKLPPTAQQASISDEWKPSYGLYVDSALANNKKLVYFTDLLPQNSAYDPSVCPGAGECLDSVTITKGNYISRIDSFIGSTLNQQITRPLSITFKRPGSSAVFAITNPDNSISILNGFDYVQITITSVSSVNSYIKIYNSGRVQIN